MKRDFLSLADWSAEHWQSMLERTLRLKKDTVKGSGFQPLKGKVMAMVFAKPSLRTRVSFEVGMHQLGGKALYIAPQEVGLGTREAPEDVARALSRYVDLIMARVFAHDTITSLARFAGCPVINGLSDYNHPCQVFADLLTVVEKKGRIEEMKIAYFGDGNNVCNSWLNAVSMLDFQLALAVPEGYDPDPATLNRAVSKAGDRVTLLRDPHKAASGADVLYTDAWTSMGQEAERQKRKVAFAGFTVDSTLLGHAAADAIVMHCLPAHRGEEITDEVMDGPQSVVFDQAENRLHAQKGIILDLMEIAFP